MPVITRYQGLQDYSTTLQRMQQFNLARHANTPDEIWLLQHPPVFTLGLNGNAAHVLNAASIPVVNTDRGGQVTYHAPGQLIAYVLFDVKRNKLGVRDMVNRLEQSVVDLLAAEDIEARAKKQAPGVYVQDAKIAALGLRIKQGGSYHGLSLNVDLDLAPFKQINPCGYVDLEVTSMKQLGLATSIEQVTKNYLNCLCRQFSIEQITEIHES
ncbi:MAG: lipoyl(octanoyl) transferase LipB [Gammaproteobacteria bacterium]|nr:lipoyl(octanoyl) transferase LipB [Gammaproteobacteria bacterium]